MNRYRRGLPGRLVVDARDAAVLSADAADAGGLSGVRVVGDTASGLNPMSGCRVADDDVATFA